MPLKFRKHRDDDAVNSACSSKRALQIDDSEDSHFDKRASASWIPQEACRPNIDEAPVYYPSEEDFKDTLGYIASICQEAERYGICRIVPPPSWDPPCPLKDKIIWKHARFTTRVQQVDKLQNREPMQKKSQNGGQRKRKRRKRLRFGMTRRRNASTVPEVNEVSLSDTDQKFGFQSGQDFTLEAFQNYANEFKEQYFGLRGFNKNSYTSNENSKKSWQPSVEEIEGEYWRIVEKPTEEVEVHYGADLETGVFGSGFPRISLSTKNKSDPYLSSGWNLNNFARLPGSVLVHERGDISGVLVPWLYIGMSFSSFCWHVEDHHLYSLNYMHFGEPKVWYGVPGSDAVKLEDAMRKHLPELFEQQPGLLHELVTQFSPSILKSEGVPVYRAVQKSGEFVLTFPRAYHSGFNCGFNCAEAVNVAPMDWLPHGQSAIEIYSEQCRKTSLSHDKLLLGAAKDAVRDFWELSFLDRNELGNMKWENACGKDGMLTQAVKVRVEMEKKRRESLCSLVQCKKMAHDFDSEHERECFSCFYDLHISAAGCECSPNRFACLTHAEFLCSCEPNRKYFLFRYEMDELNTLVKALEGDLSALTRWGKEDLGLALPSDEKVLEMFGKLRPACKSDRKVSLGKNSYISQRPLVDVNMVDVDMDAESHLKLDKGKSPILSHDAEVIHDGGCKKGEEGQKWCLDLNIEEPCTGLTFKEDESDYNIMKEQRPSASAVATVDSHEMAEIQKANEPMRMNNSLFKSNGLFRNLYEASCSGGVNHPSSSGAKVFGFDLQHHQPDPPTPLAGQLNTLHQHHQVMGKVPEVSKYVVEPLNIGSLMTGKQWCSKKAIFPKGFKSRVRYFNVFDPTKTCNYINEVMDNGILGPLFRVKMEGKLGITFTNFSAVQCWEMVQERLNEEIVKLLNLGRQNLPPPLLAGSIDGLEMFGFLSEPIIKDIEALDPHHLSSEYWAMKNITKESGSGNGVEGCSTQPNKSSGSMQKIFGVDLTSLECDSQIYVPKHQLKRSNKS